MPQTPQPPKQASKSDTHLDYGVIGNGQIAALIGEDCGVAWACLPRLDGDPVFNTLLGGQGRFRITLENRHTIEQYYDRNTAILVSEVTDTNGARIRITDFAPKFRAKGRDFRPMALVRRVEILEGTPLLSVDLHPTFNYNAESTPPEQGVSHLSYTGGDTPFRVSTNAPISFVADGTPFVPDGEVAFLLTPDEGLSTDPVTLAREWEAETRDSWRQWVKGLAIPLDYQEAVIRAAITLKLCVFEDTGGIVAALTTSIPEHEGSERNWDYRYCWVRDSYFTAASLSRLSDITTPSHYGQWLLSVVAGRAGEQIQPLFGIGLEETITEWEADSLPGFEGHKPVRVGNAAYEQVQHDVYGQIILGLAQGFFDQRREHVLSDAEWGLLEKVGEKAAAVWNTPDAGIWEFRETEQVHTSSALFCWAACDRLARIAAHLGYDDRATHWAKEADTIRKGIIKDGYNEKMGAFTASFGGDTLDASLLLMAPLGFVTNCDEKFISTVEVIDRDLRSGNHVFRYITADDFGEPETAFSACTFWHIEALHRIGHTEEAVEIFDNLLSCRNAFGLLSEDIYCKDGSLWGNYPQTYCLAGIIDCARLLSRSWNVVL